MLNAEKFKKEIESFNYMFAVVENKVVNCANLDTCENCEFKARCGGGKIKWLLEECKEPILTDKEKGYLKNVLEPLNVVVDYIRKCENYTSKDDIFYTIVVRVKHSEIFSCSYELINFVVTEEMPFKGMKSRKRYTLEELGL